MIQSVQRAVSMLECLDRAGPGGVSLSELASRLRLKRPTAHSLAKTLVALGYSSQQPGSRHYLLGQRAVTLGMVRSLWEQISQIAGPTVEALHAEVNETIVLALFADGSRHTIESRESEQALRVGASTGADRNLYGTATGRLLLSSLDDEERRAFIQQTGLPGPEWPEADSAQHIHTALLTIRARGLAEYQRPEGHIRALAVPVVLPPHAPPVALGLYYPSVRHSSEYRDTLVNALRRAAASLSADVERK